MIRSKSWLISAWNPNCSAILFCKRVVNVLCDEQRRMDGDLRGKKVVKKRKSRQGGKLVQRGGQKEAALFKYAHLKRFSKLRLCFRFDACRNNATRSGAHRTFQCNYSFWMTIHGCAPADGCCAKGLVIWFTRNS